MIDTIRHKEYIGQNIGAICKATSILKIIESQSVLEKLFLEFNCYTLNVILA